MRYTHPSKFRNEWAEVDGIKFRSKKEAHRYQELKLLKLANKIFNLEMQKQIILQPAFKSIDKIWGNQMAVKYVADFCYFDMDIEKNVIEDVKGFRTDLYLIKRKLLLFKLQSMNDTVFREVV
jgi:hypothetical protein